MCTFHGCILEDNFSRQNIAFFIGMGAESLSLQPWFPTKASATPSSGLQTPARKTMQGE